MWTVQDRSAISVWSPVQGWEYSTTRSLPPPLLFGHGLCFKSVTTSTSFRPGLGSLVDCGRPKPDRDLPRPCPYRPLLSLPVKVDTRFSEETFPTCLRLTSLNGSGPSSAELLGPSLRPPDRDRRVPRLSSPPTSFVGPGLVARDDVWTWSLVRHSTGSFSLWWAVTTGPLSDLSSRRRTTGTVWSPVSSYKTRFLSGFLFLDPHPLPYPFTDGDEPPKVLRNLFPDYTRTETILCPLDARQSVRTPPPQVSPVRPNFTLLFPAPYHPHRPRLGSPSPSFLVHGESTTGRTAPPPVPLRLRPVLYEEDTGPLGPLPR